MKKLSSNLFFLSTLLFTACGMGPTQSSHIKNQTIENFPDAEIKPYDEDGDNVTLSRDRCPNTPPEEVHLANKNGCTGPDDDGDGVINGVDSCPDTAKGESVFEDNGCMDHYYIGKFTIDYIRFEGGASETMGWAPTYWETSRADAEKKANAYREEIVEGYKQFKSFDAKPVQIKRIPIKRHFCNGDECNPNKDLKDVGKRQGLDFGNGPSNPAPGSDGSTGGDSGPGPDAPKPNAPSGPGPSGGGSGNPGGGGGSPGPVGPPAPAPDMEVKDTRAPGSGGGQDIDPDSGEQSLDMLEEQAHAYFGFQTPYATQEGKFLARVAHVLRVIDDRPSAPIGPISTRAVEGFRFEAGNALSAADDLYVGGKKSEANAYLYLASLFAEAAYDILTSQAAIEVATIGGPLAVARDAYEAISGQDIADGHTLTVFERSMKVLGVATGGLGSKITKISSVKEKLEVLAGIGRKVAQKSGRVDEVLETALKEADEIAKASNGVVHNIDGTDRIDYSSKLLTELKNFEPGEKLITGKLEEDLILVQFYAEKSINRSLAWWTTPIQAKKFRTVEDVRKGLALPPDWGDRNMLSIAHIPKGTEIMAYFGKASEQKSKLTGTTYPGGGIQYLFKDFSPSWVKSSKEI